MEAAAAPRGEGLQVTDEALLARFMREAPALPRDLAAAVADRLWRSLPLERRRAERDRLLRRAAALMGGASWRRARALAALARAAPRAGASPALDTPAGLVRAALAAYPGRRGRPLSEVQIWRVINFTGPLEMKETPAPHSGITEESTMSGRRFEAGEDVREKFIRGACAAIYTRSSATGAIAAARRHADPAVADQMRDVSVDPGEFAGASLQDLARHALELAGVDVHGLRGERLIKRALEYRDGQQGTGDFPILLETAVNKIFQANYLSADVTWRRWCGVKPVQDFRASTFYRPGAFGLLDPVSEHGEIKHKNIPDGEKAQVSVAPKGNIVSLSRRMIVNDDMGVFTDVSAGLGLSSALTIETACFALLTANSGLGANYPGTANPLFHSTRNNIGSTGAMTAATMGSARAVMSKQKDPANNVYLTTVPRIWLGPLELGDAARQIYASLIDPSKTTQVPNPVYGSVAPGNVIDSPYLSASSTTRHYFFADPIRMPVIAVGFIGGREAPEVTQFRNEEYDGIRFRILHDWGVAIVDYRGSVTCAGQ